MLITLIGGTIVICVAAFISWPLLMGAAGAVVSDAEDFESTENRLSLEKQRDNALSSLRDAEMDHETGRLSESDYGTMRAELETEAMDAIRQLDSITGTNDAASKVGFCTSCGSKIGALDLFCGQCGAQLSPH